jgi:hypothetical protein
MLDHCCRDEPARARAQVASESGEDAAALGVARLAGAVAVQFHVVGGAAHAGIGEHMGTFVGHHPDVLQYCPEQNDRG